MDSDKNNTQKSGEPDEKKSNRENSQTSTNQINYMLIALETAKKQYEMMNEGDKKAKRIELKVEGKIKVDFVLEYYSLN